MRPLELSTLPGRLAVVRLPATVPPPPWALAGKGFLALSRIGDELSIIAVEDAIPARVGREGGWRALRVDTPLEFSMTGVLASLAVPLAEAGIPILAVSTHDTDYLLVKEEQLEGAIEALTASGHRLSRPSPPDAPASRASARSPA